MAHGNNLDWLADMETVQLEKALTHDLKLVYEYCELSTLIDLLENLPSLQIFISKRSVARAQKLYIVEHFNGHNHKEMAAKLGCSERHVYQVLKNLQNDDENKEAEPDLFISSE